MGMTRHARLGNFLRQVWTGRASKTDYGKYFGLALLIYLIGIVIAAAMYTDESFSMLTVYISYLGDPGKGAGAFVYNTCEFIAGVLFVPHFVYLFRRFSPTLKVVTILCCFFGIVGCVGFAGLAFWHQGVPGDGHSVVTYVAFGGFGACLFFALFVLLRKLALHHPWPKWWQVILLYGVVLGIAGTALLFTEGNELLQGFNINPAFLADKFWEWFYFFAVLVGLIGLYLITPRDVPLEMRKDHN